MSLARRAVPAAEDRPRLADQLLLGPYYWAFWLIAGLLVFVLGSMLFVAGMGLFGLVAAVVGLLGAPAIVLVIIVGHVARWGHKVRRRPLRADFLVRRATLSKWHDEGLVDDGAIERLSRIYSRVARGDTYALRGLARAQFMVLLGVSLVLIGLYAAAYVAASLFAYPSVASLFAAATAVPLVLAALFLGRGVPKVRRARGLLGEELEGVADLEADTLGIPTEIEAGSSEPSMREFRLGMVSAAVRRDAAAQPEGNGRRRSPIDRALRPWVEATATETGPLAVVLLSLAALSLLVLLPWLGSSLAACPFAQCDQTQNIVVVILIIPPAFTLAGMLAFLVRTPAIRFTRRMEAARRNHAPARLAVVQGYLTGALSRIEFRREAASVAEQRRSEIDEIRGDFARRLTRRLGIGAAASAVAAGVLALALVVLLQRGLMPWPTLWARIGFALHGVTTVALIFVGQSMWSMNRQLARQGLGRSPDLGSA